MSRPARGAWVEMLHGAGEIRSQVAKSRPARGAWVEIILALSRRRIRTRRAPQGARGLKSLDEFLVFLDLASRPARGAWVETLPDSHCRIPP